MQAPRHSPVTSTPLAPRRPAPSANAHSEFSSAGCRDGAIGSGLDHDNGVVVLEALKGNRLSITFSVAIVHTTINKYVTSYGSTEHAVRTIIQLVGAILSSGIMIHVLQTVPLHQRPITVSS